VHSYPDPMMPIKQEGKAQVVGEFGGIGVTIPGHELERTQRLGLYPGSAGTMEGKYAAMA